MGFLLQGGLEDGPCGPRLHGGMSAAAESTKS